MNSKLPESTDSHATTGAENSLRHVRQWQIMLPSGLLPIR